jgi:hypothetical protein
MKRKEKLILVRRESIMGLDDKHESTSNMKDIADRLFHNSEVTAARGAHAVRKATLQHAATTSTISTAREVAHGFENAVEKMNRNITMRLDEITKVDRDRLELAL